MLHTQLFRGTTKVAPWPSRAFEALFKLQNVTIEPETSEITIPNPERAGLPELDGVTSTTALNCTGEAVNFSPAAAAVILYGSTERVPSGSVSGEEHDAHVDRTIKLAHMPLVVSAVTGEGGTPTYVRGIDYAVTPGGIHVLLGGQLADDINAEAAPSDGGLKSLPIEVDYTYPTVDVVSPFVTGRKFYRVLFEQVNEAGDGEKRVTEAYYVRISLNGGLPLNQGAEFGVIPVQLRMLPDPNIFEAGEASIFKMEVQNTDVA